MIISVTANHKHIDELQSIAQIFYPHARFVGENKPTDDLQCDCEITSIIEDERIVSTYNRTASHSINLNDYPAYLNQKRLAMLCLYHLLQDTTGAYTPWGALTGVRPTKMVREWMADGQTDKQCMDALQDIFKVQPSRAKLAIDVAHNENRLAAKIINPSVTLSANAHSATSPPVIPCLTRDPITLASNVAIYISIPFCPSRCIYCSFNTAHKPWDARQQTQYVQALISECQEISQEIQHTGARVSSIYIGGGTPSALTDGLLENLLEALDVNNIIPPPPSVPRSSPSVIPCLTRDPTTLVEDNGIAGQARNDENIQVRPKTIEFTLEAGRPDTITRQNLRIMRNHGVNRISINPQTFNDQTLKAIGRNHTSRDIFNAFALAREEGFTTINADIIAGLPGETEADMYHTMETLANLAPENITIHTLAVKRASKLNQNRTQQTYTPPSTDTIKSQLKIAHDACKNLGHLPYYLYRQKNMAALFENTGYSLPGHECLYNIGMMSEVQTVYGIGAGAVTKYVQGTKITRKFNVKNPEIYIERRSNP